MQKEIVQTASNVIFLQFTLFHCKLNLPQVKWNSVSNIINFVCELPNDFKPRILRN